MTALRTPGFLIWLIVLAATFALIPTAKAADDFDSLFAKVEAANRAGNGAIRLGADIILAAPLPPITGELIIEGGGHTISGGGKYRVFDVYGGALTIRNLTLRNGRARDGSGGAITMRSDYSRLTVESSSFVGNATDEDGGAINVRGDALITRSSFLDNFAADGYGGAVYAHSGLSRIANSTFHNNLAIGGGVMAVWRAEVTMTHVTMVNNLSTLRNSDAIDKLDGIVKLRNSIVVNTGEANDCDGGLDQNIGNLSLDGRCGVKFSDHALIGDLSGAPAYFPLRDYSPAIDTAHPSFCLEADQNGTPRPQGDGCDVGAIESTTALPPELPIVPPPGCTLAEQITAANTDAPAGGCPAGRGHDVITLARDIALTRKLPAITSNITIEGNGFSISGNTRFQIFAVNAGKLTIQNLTLSDANHLQGNGGAIFVRSNGAAVVRDSLFVDNIAIRGGAIGIERGGKLTVDNSRLASNRAVAGGAIYVSTTYAKVTISNSSFVANSAVGSDGIGSGGLGGAIFAEHSAAVDISNSTFINNRARLGKVVGSLYSSVTLTHVTALDSTDDGNALQNENGAINLRNSIIAGNDSTASVLCPGRLAQNVGNLISDGSCDPAYRGDPLLGESTEDPVYLPLQAGSPAIDAADARYCPDADQVGRSRPQGGGCDIGAIEWSAAGPAPSESSASPQDASACRVTTTHVLKFRDGPGGNRIGLVAQRATLTVQSRSAGWFQVEYRGAAGWISADYVETQGDCG